MKKSFKMFCLVVLVLLFAAFNAAEGANILVFGDYSSSRDILAGDLTSQGHTVTNVATLPADLTPYDTIWHVGAFTPLTAGEQTQLAGFLASGKGIHLTGERPCCEPLNASLQTFVNSVVVGGGIVVGGLGDINGPYAWNPNAAAGITTTPNALTVYTPSASGGMGGLGALPDSNILATGAGNVPVGAVWDSTDLVSGGRLTILMDVNWFESDPNRLIQIQNIETFLEGGAPAVLTSVPTLNEWGMMIFMALAVLGAIYYLRKYKRV